LCQLQANSQLNASHNAARYHPVDQIHSTSQAQQQHDPTNKQAGVHDF
jgi:hypothetical protein